MTEYSKKVFSDPALLCEKLKIYLQSPEKVEIYAQVAEIFFMLGNKTTLAKKATWSW